MAKSTTAYIGLGSNLGERKEYINKALAELTNNKQIEFGRVSNLLETTALGDANQPKYLNAVAEIKTTLSVEDFHKVLQDIEERLGRTREKKWAPRIIDLDILLFGDSVINTPNLIVPHSQMHLRSFVLTGLCQLNSKLEHPVLKVSIGELAKRLNGRDFAPEAGRAQLVSIAGNIGVGKTTLAKALAGIFGCEVLLEPYDTNPFMPQVYAGKRDLSLDSQLFFLTSRVEQLNRSTLKPGTMYVSDYIFEKEQIYAQLLLNKQQLELYNKIYKPLTRQIVSPILVIYMHDAPQNCLDRIHDRNRPYEQKIGLDFLQKINDGYEGLFSKWQVSPIIRISTLDIDYSKPSTIEYLANQIKHYITIP